MWGSRSNGNQTTVTCVACGVSIERTEAREYDKQGNRWERHGKDFEYLCKGCYQELCHQPRDGLESMLIEIEETITSQSHSLSQSEFLTQYFGTIEAQSDGESTPDSNSNSNSQSGS
jgi:hypothetical protein